MPRAASCETRCMSTAATSCSCSEAPRRRADQQRKRAGTKAVGDLSQSDEWVPLRVGREDLRRPLLNCRNRPSQQPQRSHRHPRRPRSTRRSGSRRATSARGVSSCGPLAWPDSNLGQASGNGHSSAPSKINWVQFVRTLAPALIHLGGGCVDQGAMRIESAQKSRFIGRNAGLNSLEGFFAHEKRDLHRAIVTPEPHGAQRRVVGATSIGKIKGHGPGTASKPSSLILRASIAHELRMASRERCKGRHRRSVDQDWQALPKCDVFLKSA
jgi:hypothetical protein